jgi:hypothetical protein
MKRLIIKAIACNDSIGWRERSRKMIVFSTDAGFHFAGDGRVSWNEIILWKKNNSN